jgi:CxxC-x17-CxxC domain-containing protein
MRKIMDERKILIMNLSKGKIGEDNSLLLGSLLITKLQLAAMSRVDIPEEERQDFFLYVDEFQNFATESFINILSEARKYRLSLILGHQYIKQMEEKVRDAVFGNVGTIISFRVGADDAEYLEKEFYPEFTASDLVNLPKYHIYLKLMIDGVVGKPFSAKTLPPLPIPEKSNKDKIIKVSRERYGTPRKIVEEKIAAWSGAIESLSLSKSSLPQSQVLYNAKCSLCGKDTKVIFPPDGKKPVYCKSCIKKVNKNNRDYIKKEIKEKGSESISLKDIQKKSSSLPPKKQKKKVNIEELKKVLKDSLNKYKNENP